MARALINIPTSGNIGDVKASMLTLAQFQAINGVNWVLANGSSAVGTTYAAITGAGTVPDLSGQFLRGKNNGRVDGNQDPGGERALGNLQGQATAKNGLTASSSQAVHTHAIGYMNIAYFNSGGNPTFDSNAASGQTRTSVSGEAPAITTTISGDAETRPRNVTVNYFIKVN